MNSLHRPILGSSCARATTAEELRFRIDRVIPGRSGARIISLDSGADAIVERIAHLSWGHASFHSLAASMSDGSGPGSETLVLRGTSGGLSLLTEVLTDADVVVMVATTDSDGAAAATIGAACTVRALTVAGLVIGAPDLVDGTVTALRPHARVLMVSQDDQDVVEVLTALRA